MPNNDKPIDYNQPVAYDRDGRPLYAHPPTEPGRQMRDSHVTNAPDIHQGHNFDPKTRVQYSNEPGVRHVEREIQPAKLPVSEGAVRRHEESKRLYPFLNLSAGEYVILAVRRHPIGLFIPVVTTVFGILVVLVAAVMYAASLEASTARFANAPGEGEILFVGVLVSILIGIFGYIYVWVYLQNKFFMTNESVIQEIQHSPFSKHEQTVSLGSIEDASFKQHNLVEMFFNYGTIRLSTEGEETTYRFQYVSNPKQQVAILNNAVEAFKNGRPVED